MKPKLEFFFDCSSPWTYLAFTGLPAICNRWGVQPLWRPILVGGVFNAVNKSVYEQRANPNPVRWEYMQKNCMDWANYYGITIGKPPVFPVNSVKAMRGVFVAEEHDLLEPYVEAVFHAYWSELLDISQDEILRQILHKIGLPNEEFFDKINRQDYKDKLRANTDELIARGGFGTPTLFVEDSIYFGNDQLLLVEHALKQHIATE